ncbi:AAA family ATPase [Metabacillus mangrovi]|uniref:AAA family ATPase n=1 Tax=Metabacillus mangrovi TaxID=1491830 RepID=UPI0030C85933
MDEEIWAQHGKYGIDFSPEEYEVLKCEAENKLRELMIERIKTGQSVVIDFSFWRRAKRVLYKRLIEEAGGEWRLLYLKVPPDELRRRLAIHSKRSDANAAFPITEAILTAYLEGFEEPDGEGETVIEP